MSEREDAIAAAEETCPRCGARRDPEQRYCLECGIALPAVTGRIPTLRRRWMRKIGWYPGDWVWLSLLTLVVAIVGATVAIVVTDRATADDGSTFVSTPSTVPVTVPTAVPTTTAAGTLPTAPEPTTSTTTPAKPKPKPRGPANGRISWPANANGWTIVLVSYPKVNGRVAALQTATKAARSLHQVGILDSSRYASLQPGYFVVFTGIYGTKLDADAAVATARQAGFGGAYSRQIAR